MKNFSGEAPIREKLFDSLGFLSNAWQDFFRLISEALWYLGQENIYTLKNNQTTDEKITGLSFDKRFMSAAFVDYLIQRVTDSDEKIEVGTFKVYYKPNTDSWGISNAPNTSGVTLSIDASGDTFYQTTNQSGTLKISRIVLRTRLLKGKSYYSSMGLGSIK